MNKKSVYYAIAALAVAVCMSIVGCSSDDSGNNDVPASPYSYKTYGDEAIDACATLVKELEEANAVICSTELSKTQDDFLRGVTMNFVSNIVFATYLRLSDDAEALEDLLNKLDAATISQSQVDEVCAVLTRLREDWKLTEAYQMGGATYFGIERLIDSWPLNLTELQGYLNRAMYNYKQEWAHFDIDGELKNNGGSIVGLHALEFIFFRDGKNRDAKELQEKATDPYSGFTNVYGAVELDYARQLSTMLKLRTYQLFFFWYPWPRDEPDASTRALSDSQKALYAERFAALTAEGLPFRYALGGDYAHIMVNHTDRKDVVPQILSATTGSCAAIVNEVRTSMLARPFLLGQIDYIEAPYSQGTIKDMRDNILSVRNVWYGSTDGTIAEQSFAKFFEEELKNTVGVEAAINNALNKMDALPSPFMQYCKTIWDE